MHLPPPQDCRTLRSIAREWSGRAIAGGVIFGDLYKAKAITNADLNAAIDAFLADPTLTLFMMGEGHRVDLAAAVAGSLFATELVADPKNALSARRNAVRTAILLARPVKF